ncbi:MAG: hypothetical protein COA90_07255 [Gammaproteobacteria bacterium]|nr:MAG: hypothetical protein COA90_07255 [Gammaproteobacteria bacterium]
MRIFITILVSIVITSCSKLTPEQVAQTEQCYGGNYSKYLNGRSSDYSSELTIPESEWLVFREKLEVFSSEHNLNIYFDVQKTFGWYSSSICSSDGLYLNIYSLNIDSNEPFAPFHITLYAYKDREKWIRFSKLLESFLIKNWKEYYNGKPVWTSDLRQG